MNTLHDKFCARYSLNVYNSKRTYCLVKNDGYNIDYDIWKSDFQRDIKRIVFENYFSYFIRSIYPYSLFTNKKLKLGLD